MKLKLYTLSLFFFYSTSSLASDNCKKTLGFVSQEIHVTEEYGGKQQVTYIKSSLDRLKTPRRLNPNLIILDVLMGLSGERKISIESTQLKIGSTITLKPRDLTTLSILKSKSAGGSITGEQLTDFLFQNKSLLTRYFSIETNTHGNKVLFAPYSLEQFAYTISRTRMPLQLNEQVSFSTLNEGEVNYRVGSMGPLGFPESGPKKDNLNEINSLIGRTVSTDTETKLYDLLTHPSLAETGFSNEAALSWLSKSIDSSRSIFSENIVTSDNFATSLKEILRDYSFGSAQILRFSNGDSSSYESMQEFIERNFRSASYDMSGGEGAIPHLLQMLILLSLEENQSPVDLIKAFELPSASSMTYMRSENISQEQFKRISSFALKLRKFYDESFSIEENSAFWGRGRLHENKLLTSFNEGTESFDEWTTQWESVKTTLELAHINEIVFLEMMMKHFPWPSSSSGGTTML